MARPLELPKPTPTVRPENAAKPPIQLPPAPGTGMVPTTQARPILSLQNGSIPNAINRVNAPASNALNAINGRGASVPGAPPPPPKPVMAGAPPAPPTAPPVAAAAPGVPPPQPSAYAQQVNSNIVQQAKQRASIAASGATAPTGAPALSTAPAQAPGLASRALNAVNQRSLKALPYVAPVYEAASIYNDVTTEGMTPEDNAGRVVEGGVRTGLAYGGAQAGAAYGGAVAGPPGAFVGGLGGGIAGYTSPELTRATANYAAPALGAPGMEGKINRDIALNLAGPLALPLKAANWLGFGDGLTTENIRSALPQFSSEKAAGFRQQQEVAAAEAQLTPEVLAQRKVESLASADASGVKNAGYKRAGSPPTQGAPSSAIDSAQKTPAPTPTASPERFAEISGYDGPKQNVNRRYSLEELTKLGERNVIPSASFTNPGAGVALSEASGGRFNLGSPTSGRPEAYLIDGNGKEYAAGQTGGSSGNPITQYRNEVSAAQSRNRATNERATAIINARPDETTQRLMSGAESALGAGQKRKAAGFVDLLQAYNGSKPSDALERQRKPQEPTPDEEAMAAIQRQKEESSAEILGIQAGQAKRAYQLQEALLAAPPEEQGAIKAQLDAVMGRNAPQAKPDPGAITPKDRYREAGQIAASEMNPTEKAKLIERQQALDPPVPGAIRGTDPNGVPGWYVVKDGQRQKVDY